MIDRKDWPEDARNAQAAFDERRGTRWRDTATRAKWCRA